jgi:hypothetical protein
MLPIATMAASGNKEIEGLISRLIKGTPHGLPKDQPSKDLTAASIRKRKKSMDHNVGHRATLRFCGTLDIKCRSALIRASSRADWGLAVQAMRDAQNTMMICCSRSKSSRLVLD